MNVEITPRRLLGWLLVAGLALAVYAGSLEPPGPPASTMKDLNTVEPRFPIRAADLPLTITAPGSYYFTEDMAVSAGITINAEDVTVDLNGFTLYGGGATTDGIVLVAAANDVEIKNGIVALFPQDGIDAELASRVRLIDLRVTENGGDGIKLGNHSVVERSLISGNGDDGIHAIGDNNRIAGNQINANTFDGIHLSGDANHVRDNSVSTNSRYGIYAAELSVKQTIVDNLLTDNGVLSIETGEFTSDHIVARNISRKTPPNANNRAGDWGPAGTAASSTSPWANIEN